MQHLVLFHASALGIRWTASDGVLLRKQLDILDRQKQIRLVRKGRFLVAEIPQKTPVSQAVEVPKSATAHPELEVLKAYARQLDNLAATLHEHVTILVDLVRRAARD